MEILSLKFKNIHSLAGEHEINFARPPLSDTGILAIVGPTGAGKSTILDAITLALYDRIARFANEPPTARFIQTYGGIVTRGFSSAYSQITFSVNNKKFTSRWELSGNKRIMILSENNQIIATGTNIVPNKIQQIIGLDFNQFIRSVILPQGQFTAFLLADSDEKIKLLERITHTENFRNISIFLFNYVNDLKNSLDQQKAALNEINLLSDQQINQIKKQLAFLSDLYNKQKNQLQTLEQKIKLLQQINQLQSEKNKLSAQLQKTEQKITQLKPLISQLETHKKLLPFIAEFTKLDSLSNQKNLLLSKKSTLENTISSLRSQLLNTENNLTKLQKQLQQQKNLLLQQQPLAEKAKKLDNQINTLASNKQQLLSQIKKFDIQSLNAQLLETQKQLKQLQLKLQQLLSWQNTNSSLQNLQSDLPKISEQLENLIQLQNEIQTLASKYTPNLNIKNLQQAHSSLQHQISQISQYIQTLKQSLHFNKSPEQLTSMLEQLSQKLSSIQKLQQLLDFFNNLSKQKQNILSQLSNLQHHETDLLKQIDLAQKLLKIKENQRIIAEKNYEIEDIKAKSQQIRSLLKEGEPCPVCGATSHPYVKLGVKIQLSLAKQNLEKAKNEYQNALNQLNSLKQKLSAITSKKQTLQNQLNQVSSQISQHDELISSLSQKLNLPNIPPSTHDLNTLKQTISQQKNFIRQDLKTLNQIQNNQQLLTSLTQILQTVNKALQLKKRLSTTIKPYQTYLPPNTTHSTLKQHLSLLLKQWNQNQLNIQNAQLKISSLKSSITEQQKNIHNIQTRINELQKQINEINNQITQLSTQRQKIFPHPDPDAFLKKITQNIENIQNQLAQTQTSKAKLSAKINELNNQISDIQNQLNQLTDSIQIISSSLLNKISPLGFSSVESAKQALLPPDKAQSIDEQIKKLNSEKLSLSAQIQQLSNNITSLSASNLFSTQPIESLQKQYEQLFSQLHQTSQNLGKLNEKLNENNTLKKRYDQINKQIQSLQQQLARWQRLNDLIGSSDGDKFQRIVQTYNFKNLTLLANIYLNQFQSRYRLDFKSINEHKRQKLELFVIDTLMNNQLRNVRTLSGGERFIISLSLALALSAMASQNTQIKSLFIDEGFGSLDQNSLDSVLAKLEHFQFHTNKKITIISHVPQLKERIPVKILVQKGPNGLSSIKILNS